LSFFNLVSENNRMTDRPDTRITRQSRSLLGYGALLIGVALAYLCIRAYGNTLVAPAPIDPSSGVGKFSQIHVNDFVHVLLALALVIASARALGAIFRLIKQPPVVGEMIAGILLGPSLLGHIAPSFASYILPQSIAPLLNVISQFGVILYMFLVGLELDVSALRDRAHSTIAISHASIVTPFLLGAGLALLLYPHLSNNTVSFTAFSLFLGVSMSVTAFPVLARILTDRRIHKTKMGVLTLACAAVDDVTAWCLLAFVVSVTQSRAGGAVHTLLMAIVYIAAMLFIVRPLVVRLTIWIDGKGRVTQGALAFVLLGILFSSLATESIGIHSIFGAFVLGAIIPHGSSLARELAGKLEDFVIVFLLPAFFAFTGLRTQIGLVSGTHEWMFCLLIILVASAGKFGGSAFAARLSGLTWRDASALGVLMNTRGLMELIVLNIGLELHVISSTLFAMLVIMALTTTLATSPILHFITPRRQLEQEANQIEEESRLNLAINDRAGALIPVSSTSGVAGLLEIALSLTPAEAPPPRVLALNRGSVTAVSSKIREAETFSPSRSPILAAALDAAWSRGIAIKPEAVWTTDAATEIVDAAEKANVRWVLLESRRSIFGRYPKRSVVNKVMDSLGSRPLNVAVLIQPATLKRSPVTCIVHGAEDGRSAFELATLLSRSWSERLQVLVLPSEAPSAGNSRAHTNDWLNHLPSTGVQLARFVCDAKNLSAKMPSGLVVIAKDVVDVCEISIDGINVERSVIVVQGGGKTASGSASHPVAWDLLSPSVM
jgi:Kef-type K+ transport system membrane component KefB